MGLGSSRHAHVLEPIGLVRAEQFLMDALRLVKRLFGSQVSIEMTF